MTVLPPPPPHEPPVDERAREIANAQPVRLVSIDEITIGELMSLLFKLAIASIPVAIAIGLLWLFAWAMISSIRGH